VSRSADPEAADPYEANFLPIRGLVLRLLQARPFPIASRLFFGAFFADQTRTTLRRGAAGFDARALEELGRSLGITKNLERLHLQLQQVSVDATYGVGVVRELLRMPGNAVVAPLARLVDELEPLFAAHGASLTSPAAELRRAYQALPALPPALAERLDLLASRYAQHEVLRNWYVEAPSFASAYHALLLRVAVVRFVAGGLARKRALHEPAALDALAVQVVYLLGRMLDGNSELESQVFAGLEKSGARLEDALALLRV
jgi:hypothetical protein